MEIEGLGKGNHIPKMVAIYRANPLLWGQVPSFVIHHNKECGLFHNGDCDCDPDVELEGVDYQTG